VIRSKLAHYEMSGSWRIMNGKTVDTTLDPNFKNPIPRPIAEYDMDKTP
jgi:hypothetical protein